MLGNDNQTNLTLNFAKTLLPSLRYVNLLSFFKKVICIINIETSKILLLIDDSERKLSNERMNCILRARNFVVNDMCSGIK